jgi:hypothetical protein
MPGFREHGIEASGFLTGENLVGVTSQGRPFAIK